MKLLGKQLDRLNAGRIKLLPQEPEDLWHAFNIIAVGDRVVSKTIRKVVKESSTGSVVADRRNIVLTIRVIKIEFDMDAGQLRLSGVNVCASDAVKLGAHHTLEIECGRSFTVEKDEWDSVAMARVEESCDPTKSAEVAAVIMGEGIAAVCLITDTMTIVRSRIDMQIPRKRKMSSGSHDKSLVRFYEAVMQAVLANIDFDHVKCVIVGSPAFTKDQFLQYMNEEAIKREIAVLKTHKSLFLPVHCSSGHLMALKEIMEDESIMSRISDTKASGEVLLLKEFFTLMKEKPDMTVYGRKHVQKALELKAIRTLMLTDALFRSTDIETRRSYVALVDAVREAGMDVKIFSSLHVSGQQLAQLCGVAAILRYPCPGIEDDVDEDEEEQDEEQQEQLQGFFTDGKIVKGADSTDDDAGAA